MKKAIINFKASILSKKSQLPYEIGKILLREALQISSAESCTGGLISSRLTDVAGSSAYIKANFVTYSNEAKHKILNVSEETLKTYGAVSEECAREMAEGLHKVTGADICVSTTGIAGPAGGTKEKPVGLMYSGIYFQGKTSVYKILLPSNIERVEMKQKFTKEVLNNIYTTINFL